MKTLRLTVASSVLLLGVVTTLVLAQEPQKKPDPPPDPAAVFQAAFDKMSAAKAAKMRDARDYLEKRYDLSNHSSSATMFRGKPV